MGQIKNKLQMIYLSPNINILTLDESGLKTPIKGRDCQTGKKKQDYSVLSTDKDTD